MAMRGMIPKGGWSVPVVVLALFAISRRCEGSIYQTSFDSAVDGSIWEITEGGMYAGRDPKRPTAEGKGEVLVDLKFSRTKQDTPGTIELLLMRPEQASMVGYVDPDSGAQSYCCNEELRRQNVAGCKEVGKLILRQPRTIKSKPVLFGGGFFIEPLDPDLVSFKKGEDLAVYNETLIIHRTGIYTLMVAFCDEDAGTVSVAGRVAFRNPYGYLPGQLYGFIPSYLILGSAYAVLSLIVSISYNESSPLLSRGIFMELTCCVLHVSPQLRAGSEPQWIGFCLLRKSALVPLHYYVSAMLFLGGLEAIVHYFTYVSLNNSGKPTCCPLPVGVIAADLISVLKIVPSKVLVLLVSMGWQITVLTVERKAKWVMYYAGLSLVLSIIHELAASKAHNEHLPTPVTLFVTLPMYVIDLVLILWVFSELRSTRNKLHDRGATEKERVYIRFTNALRAFLGGMLLWAIWAFFVAYTSPTTDRWRFMHWKSYFLVGGLPPGGVMWDLLYFCLLVLMMVLFLPGERSSSISYRPEVENSVNVGLTAMTDFGGDSSEEEF